MTTFDESLHPRANDGTFTEKAQTRPEVALSPGDLAYRHFEKISEEAGLGGIGPHLLELATHRADIDDVAAQRITGPQVADGYEDYLAPAIDRTSYEIQEMQLAPTPDWEDAVRENAAAAGLPVMEEVCSIIADREELPDNSVLGALSPEELARLYGKHISEAVDEFALTLAYA